MLTLYPSRSLIHNIENDASGTHSHKENKFNVRVQKSYVPVERISVEQSLVARQEFIDFFKSKKKKIYLEL